MTDGDRPWESWCGGLRQQSQGPMGPDERLGARAIARRLHGRRRWARVAVGCLLATTGLAAVIGGPRGATATATTGAATLAISGGAAGLWGWLHHGPRRWRMVTALGCAYLAAVTVARWLAAGVLGRSLTSAVEDLAVSVAAALLLLGWGRAATAMATYLGLFGGLAALERDCRRGWVLRFASPETPTADGPRSLAVLPHSGWVVAQNEASQATPWRVPIRRLAAGWVHGLRVGLTREGSLLRRRLSPAERDELLQQVRQLRRPHPGWSAVTLTAAGFTALCGLDPGLTSPGWIPLDALFWLGLLGVSLAVHVRRLLAAHRLQVDARLRWVVTWEHPPDSGQAPELEVLPISRLTWTEQSRPAGWRVAW